jgi:hypothetical protein
MPVGWPLQQLEARREAHLIFKNPVFMVHFLCLPKAYPIMSYLSCLTMEATTSSGVMVPQSIRISSYRP